MANITASDARVRKLSRSSASLVVESAGARGSMAPLRLPGDSLVSANVLLPAALHLHGVALAFGLGGLGRHGLGGGSAGLIIVVVLMGLRIYMRSRGGGRGPRGRGPWR